MQMSDFFLKRDRKLFASFGAFIASVDSFIFFTNFHDKQRTDPDHSKITVQENNAKNI